MNRRTFVGHLSAGLAFQALPASLMAGSVSSIPPTTQSASWIDKAAESIQSGLLGTLQHLTVSRIYSPELTSQTTLRAMARQDFDLAGRLLKTNLAIDPNTLFTDLPSSLFGSFSARFYQAGMALTWQGLARIGGRASGPTSTLRIMGSQGVLQIATHEGGYQLLDLRGRLMQSEPGAGQLLAGSTHRGLFDK